ncbi:MAG: Diguanylate cyclase/phosphodiesterase with pas/pac sensor(S) [Syntrophaceae bacterium]|nr:MAG: Diguanylate cyclase/phosphodiesterase with pas/pac sensor(S) [Syntrophaceae bacterium]
MKDQTKTKQALIQELSSLKHRIQELERAESEHKHVEEALRESEEKYRNILESIQEGYFELDLAGNYTFVNEANCRFLGYTKEELVGMNYRQHTDEETAKKLYQPYYELYRTGKSIETLEVESFRKDGIKVIYETSVSLIRDSEGKPIGFRGVSRDITDRKQATEALLESEKRYRALVENASDLVFRLDAAGHFTFVNPVARRIVGYGEKELIGKHYATLIRSDMREEAMKFFGRQFVKGIPNTYSEYPIILKDGREIWVGQNVQLLFQDGKGIAFQAVARDITERRQAEEALRESEKRYQALSIVDELTQCYNSRHFYVQLKIEVERSSRYELPLTLLLLDLDDFKAFNDAYGHVEGDRVLTRLGQVVKRCLRETDSAYRYGGEEFTILLPMTTSADGAVTAERIRAEFKKENFSPDPGKDVNMTVSIGLGQYKTSEDMKVFVHRVDQLMYQGKKNGKDRVCCES